MWRLYGGLATSETSSSQPAGRGERVALHVVDVEDEVSEVVGAGDLLVRLVTLAIDRPEFGSQRFGWLHSMIA